MSGKPLSVQEKIIKKIPISPVVEKKVYDLLSKRKKDLSPYPD